MILTYKFPLRGSAPQYRALDAILEQQRQLYNAALQERIECYRRIGGTLSWGQQCRSVTEWLRDDPAARLTHRGVYDLTLRRLHRAYEAFFRRVRAGEKPGFPRFRGFGQWEGFGTADADEVRLAGERLRVLGVPGILRVQLHREIPGRPKAMMLRRSGRRWWVCFTVEVEAAPPRDAASQIGIDLGLTAFVALSDGRTVPAPQLGRKAQHALRVRQRALARCKRGSKRRRKVRVRLARVRERTANARRTFLHQLSAGLVRDHGLIAAEKLNVRGMVRGHFGRSIHDAGWSTFTEMLRYKAEKAGGRLIEVDPRNTSQACSGCGVIVPKTLADRTHECPDCGLSLDRDVNAARNVLRKGIAALEALNVAQRSVRAPGNLAALAAAETLLPVTQASTVTWSAPNKRKAKR